MLPTESRAFFPTMAVKKVAGLPGYVPFGSGWIKGLGRQWVISPQGIAPFVGSWLVVSNIFYFHPCLGKISILTNIFEMG